MKNKVHFLFIEKCKARHEHLDLILDNLAKEVPDIYSYQTINSSFDATLTEALDYIEEQNAKLAPAFVMIDPFGVSGTPMDVIGRILDNPKSEVYVSFMYGWINRFRAQPNFEKSLDELFGCPDWRRGIDIADREERKNFFYRLYEDQLRKNGATQVVKFELYKGNKLVYAIFFGTKNFEGIDKMKQAIWKVAPFGDFKFRGGEYGQLIFGGDIVDCTPLESELQQQFQAKGWQRVEDITAFVKSDATLFHSGHLKMKTLRPMEKSGLIVVKREPGTKPMGISRWNANPICLASFWA